MKQNLTLENFWNDLYKNHPAGTKVFCDWIDKYKAENNWNVLFNGKFKVIESDKSIHSSPKYHDLPWAMQFGIWIEFMLDFCKKQNLRVAYHFRDDFNLGEQIIFDVTEIEKLIT